MTRTIAVGAVQDVSMVTGKNRENEMSTKKTKFKIEWVIAGDDIISKKGWWKIVKEISREPLMDGTGGVEIKKNFLLLRYPGLPSQRFLGAFASTQDAIDVANFINRRAIK